MPSVSGLVIDSVSVCDVISDVSLSEAGIPYGLFGSGTDFALNLILASSGDKSFCLKYFAF